MSDINEYGGAFGPDEIDIISRGYVETCNALGVFAGDQRGRAVIAARIIDLAGSGVMDAKALRDRVLLEVKLAA